MLSKALLLINSLAVLRFISNTPSSLKPFCMPSELHTVNTIFYIPLIP